MRIVAPAIATFVAAVTILAVLAAPALAQNSADNFSNSHLRKARDVIELTRSDRAFDDILPDLAERTQTLFIRSNPALTREIEAAVLEIALEMAPRRVELSRQLQEIWARRFSEAELDQLITFFSSDVGTKFTEATPVITALALGAGRQWEERLANEMVEATRAKLREQGHAL